MLMLYESILGIVIGLVLSYFSIALSKQQGRFDLFAPPMLLLCTMWLQYYLPAFTLPYYDYWVYPHRWEKSQVVLYPILLASVAWVAFLCGYRSRLGRVLSHLLPAPVPLRATIWTGWVLTLVGLASLLMAVKQSGGLLQIAQSGSVSVGTGIWIYLGFLTLTGSSLMFSYRNTRTIAIFASIVYFTVLMAAQGRGIAIEIFIILFIIAKYVWNLNNVIIILLGYIFTIFVFVVSSVGRVLIQIKSFSSLILFIVQVITNFFYTIILTINRDLSRLEQLSIVMELIPEQIDYFLGVPMVQCLFGPFLKYLFPDTIDWRTLLTAVAIYGSPTRLSWGMGGTGVGEWYANFGLVGVIIGWLLFGIVARCLYQWFQQSRQGRPQTVLLPVYVLLLWVLWGCMSESVGHLFSIWLLIPIMITSRWVSSASYPFAATCEERGEGKTHKVLTKGNFKLSKEAFRW